MLMRFAPVLLIIKAALMADQNLIDLLWNKEGTGTWSKTV